MDIQIGRGNVFMGFKTFKIGKREALEITCDRVAHRGEPGIAWFDCGSDLGNLALAMAAGWQRRKANGVWLCPRCAQQDLKRDGVRNRADEARRGKCPA
jgi:hypothetical protein